MTTLDVSMLKVAQRQIRGGPKLTESVPTGRFSHLRSFRGWRGALSPDLVLSRSFAFSPL